MVVLTLDYPVHILLTSTHEITTSIHTWSTSTHDMAVNHILEGEINNLNELVNQVFLIGIISRFFIWKFCLLYNY